MEHAEENPYTWAKLKEFCNSLTEEQLQQTVRVIQEEGSIEILDASELDEDKYLFDDEEYSVGRSDFDPNYHFDGKYKTFDEALANEKDYAITPKTNVYLYEKF